MINPVFVDMFAYKIFSKEINPLTNKEFIIEDVKKEEYKQPILNKIKNLEDEAKKDGELINGN